LTRTQGDASHEFSTLLGMYVANIEYLNADWLKANIDRIFSTKNADAWMHAASGFVYVSGFSRSLYDLLRAQGHLAKILATDFDDQHVHEVALQFLAIGYLNGLDRLDEANGLIASLIRECDVEKIRHLLWVFWTLRGSGALGDHKDRIIDLWEAVLQRIADDKSAYKRVLSRLNLLAVFIDNIDGRVETLWKDAAAYAEVDFNGTTLVEEMARLSEAFPAAIGRIFLSALTNSVPTYDPKHIQECVRHLYERGEKDLADQICEKYERAGHGEIVRSIYRTYR